MINELPYAEYGGLDIRIFNSLVELLGTSWSLTRLFIWRKGKKKRLN